jgi:hypothetical protein
MATLDLYADTGTTAVRIYQGNGPVQRWQDDGEGLSAGIKVSRTAGIVPFTVFVEPVITPAEWGLKDEHDVYHELDYKWNSDRDGHAPAKFDKCPAFFDQLNWRDRRIGYGPKMAFVYETPGDFVLELEVRDRKGRVKTATVDITASEADTTFADLQTIVVKADGNYTGAPAGAVRVRKLAEAKPTMPASNLKKNLNRPRAKAVFRTSAST